MTEAIKGIALIDDIMAGKPVPTVCNVKCESRTVAAMVTTALAMRGYTIVFEEKAPLDLACQGPRVSEKPPFVPYV